MINMALDEKIVDWTKDIPKGDFVVSVNDIKEAVRELKEDCCRCHVHIIPKGMCLFCYYLHKRFGEGLV